MGVAFRGAITASAFPGKLDITPIPAIHEIASVSCNISRMIRCRDDEDDTARHAPTLGQSTVRSVGPLAGLSGPGEPAARDPALASFGQPWIDAARHLRW